MRSNILFRTDAGVANGSGHAMRCLALAQACHDAGIGVALASAELPAALVHRWRVEGAAFYQVQVPSAGSEDAGYTASLAHRLNASWVVIDGYHFSSGYQRLLQQRGCKVLFIDDCGHAEHDCADVVLNQNSYASAALYPRLASSARLLLGLRYLLLRREFRDRSSQPLRTIPRRASKLLVTLGGSDPDNATETVLEALRLLDASSMQVRVVIGGSNPRAETIAQMASSLPLPVETIHDPAALSQWMDWADLAVSAAGTTAWELAFMGVPFLATSIAANQRPVAQALERNHIALDLGPGNDLCPDRLAGEILRLARDYEARTSMSRAGQNLIDGHGAYRVLQAIGLVSLRLQLVRDEDSNLLWEWANDPDVRKVSFSSDPISWAVHQQWFALKSHDPACAFWVARDADDQSVGQIRFDCHGEDEVYISTSLAPAWRGKGYGRQLIRAGLREARRVFPGRSAHAYIKVENVASVHAFEAAGFSLAGEETVQGSKAFHYVAQSVTLPGAVPVQLSTTSTL